MDSPLPLLHHVRQHWASTPIDDIPSHIVQQLDSLALRDQIRPGMRIAVTAGSRGIRQITTILRATAEWLRHAGAYPFIVPAMGSHGGATTDGQVALLAHLGITEESTGCPILATMDVVSLGTLADGTPVVLDRYAAEADGIVLINRIKPHTSFRGEIESGLTKMCVIGLGNHIGAQRIHQMGITGLRTHLVPIAHHIIAHVGVRGGIIAGLAILEDANEQTADIVALPAHAIGCGPETALLERSRTLLPRLPFDSLDVLVVDEIGKHISGTGMDTNVIGRLRIPTQHDPLIPHISVIVALDLAEASNGNATGMGLADLITRKLADKIDFSATYTNTLTAGMIGLQRGALPITLPTAHDAITTAIRVCGVPDGQDVRLVRIRNTLQIADLWVSAALLPDVAAHSHLELLGEGSWS